MEKSSQCEGGFRWRESSSSGASSRGDTQIPAKGLLERPTGWQRWQASLGMLRASHDKPTCIVWVAPRDIFIRDSHSTCDHRHLPRNLKFYYVKNQVEVVPPWGIGCQRANEWMRQVIEACLLLQRGPNKILLILWFHGLFHLQAILKLKSCRFKETSRYANPT